MERIGELIERAGRVDEALKAARQAWLMWDARRRQGFRVPAAPPPEALVDPAVAAEAEQVAVVLCDAYRAGDASDRASLLAGTASLQDIAQRVAGILGEAERRVRGDHDAEWLERGWAAAALLDPGVWDVRDRLIALQGLWRAAEKAGLADRTGDGLSPPAHEWPPRV